MVVVDKQADGIHAKHLFTLQPGISENQTEEMKKSNLQLVVVPEALKTTYTNEQQGWRWCSQDFVKHVLEVQTSL